MHNGSVRVGFRKRCLAFCLGNHVQHISIMETPQQKVAFINMNYIIYELIIICYYALFYGPIRDAEKLKYIVNELRKLMEKIETETH